MKPTEKRTGASQTHTEQHDPHFLVRMTPSLPARPARGRGSGARAGRGRRSAGRTAALPGPRPCPHCNLARPWPYYDPGPARTVPCPAPAPLRPRPWPTGPQGCQAVTLPDPALLRRQPCSDLTHGPAPAPARRDAGQPGPCPADTPARPCLDWGPVLPLPSPALPRAGPGPAGPRPPGRWRPVTGRRGAGPRRGRERQGRGGTGAAAAARRAHLSAPPPPGRRPPQPRCPATALHADGPRGRGGRRGAAGPDERRGRRSRAGGGAAAAPSRFGPENVSTSRLRRPNAPSRSHENTQLPLPGLSGSPAPAPARPRTHPPGLQTGARRPGDPRVTEARRSDWTRAGPARPPGLPAFPRAHPLRRRR